MSKRNFILLIIIVILAVITVFGFLYFQTAPPAGENGNETPGTNFISQFNPFGTSTIPTPAT
ncbi:MAG TPA: hypothetical protein VK675_04885, partial [Candidatus Paceibacterota bacterium]|nr:hypothetical protein [Candidatus Paceibacterota bacterium]